MKLKLKNEIINVKGFNEIKSLLTPLISINELETIIEGETQVALIDITNASGKYDMEEVAKTVGANMVQPLKGNNKEHHISGLNQKVYRLYFGLDKMASLKEVNKIEKRLVEKVKDNFGDIDRFGDDSVEELIPTPTNKRIIKEEGWGNYKIIDSDNQIKVDSFNYIDKDTKDLEELAQLMFKENAVIPKELIAMAEFINSKDSVVISEDLYKSLAIGVWNSQQYGEYSEDIAVQILGILDNHKHDEEYYKSFKIKLDKNYKGKIIRVATFIWFAQQNGYTRNFLDRFHMEEGESSLIGIPVKELLIKQYINKNIMYELFSNPYRNILINAPTGSGKTTATAEALIKWLNEDPMNRYAYFALPTRAQADQSTAEGKYGKPLMNRELASTIMKHNKESMNVNFAFGTFDKSIRYVEELSNNPDAEIIIIADEAHKEVLDYFFRMRAIKGLFDLRDINEKIVKFVGLSGTTQEIDKNYYDQMVKVKVKDAKPVFDKFKVLTYDKQKDFKNIITQLIANEVSEGRKVLQFLNNKESIKDIKELLETKEMGIKVVGVHADIQKDTPEGEVYNYLMEEQKFPSGYDVVLATSVISDGINILNEDKNYSVIIGTDRQTSPVYNLSTIKQMSNRFRNQYEHIIVPLFIPSTATKDRLTHTALYGMEERYQTLVRQSELLAGYLKDRFGDNFNVYHPSYFELALGLPHVNSIYDNVKINVRFNIKSMLERYRHIMANPNHQFEGDDIEIVETVQHVQDHLFSADKRALRKTASKDAEQYYSYFPYAFINGLEQILDMKSDENTVENYLLGQNAKVGAFIQTHYAEKEELKKEEDKVKREKVRVVLTEELFIELKHLYFRNGNKHPTDLPIWVELKELMSLIDLNILKDNMPFMDYEGVLAVMDTVTRPSDSLKFRRRLIAINTVEAFNKADERTQTNYVIDKIKEFVDDESNYEHHAKGTDFISNAMINRLFSEIAGSQQNMKASEVKKIMDDYFVFENFKSGATRGKGNFELINLKNVGRIYNIDEYRMEKIYDKFTQIELVA